MQPKPYDDNAQGTNSPKEKNRKGSFLLHPVRKKWLGTKKQQKRKFKSFKTTQSKNRLPERFLSLWPTRHSADKGSSTCHSPLQGSTRATAAVLGPRHTARKKATQNRLGSRPKADLQPQAHHLLDYCYVANQTAVIVMCTGDPRPPKFCVSTGGNNKNASRLDPNRRNLRLQVGLALKTKVTQQGLKK